MGERNERLADEVEALASESLALHDRLWHAHERSSRLKVALGRRRAVTVRPEAPLTIGGSGRRRAGTADRLLADLAHQKVEMELPARLVERATALASRASWHDQRFDDALLLVLAHGLAALESERAPDDLPERASPPPLEPLARRVFDMLESIRILEIRQNAFRIDNGGMRRRLAELEREVDELEGEMAASRAEGPGSRPGGIGRRLLGRLLRRRRGSE
jgi:hypothetical protein